MFNINLVIALIVFIGFLALFTGLGSQREQNEDYRDNDEEREDLDNV